MASKKQAPPARVHPPQWAGGLRLSREQLTGWDRASTLEWLVGNGIGGYASGTMAGANTRRYHGFLVAAVDPPAGRVVLVAHMEETVSVDGETYPLASSQWWDGTVSPRGYEQLDGFHLEDGIPVFSYRCGTHILEKRVWMEHGDNVAWAAYSWPEGAPAAVLSLKLCLACRDYHGSQHGSSTWHWRSTALPDGIAVSPGDTLTGMTVRCESFQGLTPENEWYWGFLHAVERERGLDDVEDLWVPGSLQAALTGWRTLFVTAGIEGSAPAPSRGAASLERERARRTAVLECARATGQAGRPSGRDAAASDAPSSLVSTLVSAADAFLVSRPLPGS
ncbi:MAG: glycogen debranching enzyme N-terminal domain-containing protein, partial [Chloroflexi bacterium]|nr:glycogen debranching enzyme N-terminal domain-containing protein [Chloroflexota bacterium]